MKNSKVLSLLTAGAMVVSSFSGLAMNGGVARAAALTIGTITEYPTYDTAETIELYGGDTLTLGAAAGAATKFSVIAIADNTGAAKDTKGKLTGAGLNAASDDFVAVGAAAATAVENVKYTAPTTAAVQYLVFSKDEAAAANTFPAGTLEKAKLDVRPKRTDASAAATVVSFTKDKLTTKAAVDAAGATNIAIDVDEDGEEHTLTGYIGVSDAANYFVEDAATNGFADGYFTVTATGATKVANSAVLTDSLTVGAGAIATDTMGYYIFPVSVKVDTEGLTEDATTTITIASTPKLGAGTVTFTVSFKATGATPGTDDPTEGKVPFASFKAVGADGTDYTDGKNTLVLQVPRAKIEGESNDEYLKYVRSIAKKNVTIEALWSVSADERANGTIANGKITFTPDNKATGSVSGPVETSVLYAGDVVVNDNDYGTSAANACKAIDTDALNTAFAFDTTGSDINENWTGLVRIVATADVTPKGGQKTQYASIMELSVKVVVADGAGVTLIPGSNNTELVNKYDWDPYTTDIKPLGRVANIKKYGPSVTLDNGETGAASLRWRVDWTTGTVSEDNLKYAWSFVKDNGGTTAATSKWITDDEANKIFTMTGTDTERVTFMPTTYVLGGDYILRGEIKSGDGNLVAVAYVNIHLVAEAGSSLSVVVNTSKLEKGYVEVPAATTVVEEVTVKVTRGNGSDVTKDSDISYAIVPFADYITAKNQNRLANLGSAYGLSIDKNKTALKIQHSAEPGAYVVVVKDGKLDNYAVDEENLIQIKSGNGQAVTGLQVDQNTVTITNLNSEKCVWATVLPTEYQDNGYTKVAAKSAEVNAVKYTVADPSVVDVTLVAGHQYLQTTHEMDNTWNVWIRARKVGDTKVTLTTLDGGFTQVIDVTVLGTEPTPTPEPEPTPEHKAGDAFTVDGVSVFVNADGKTLTVTDVTVVGKTATIPATVDGLEVTTIAAQTFKKSDAKTIYVKAAVTDIEKGAFKKAKTKKIFFYEPAALNTVAKNAFKGANVKVVGVGGSFSESAASQLKKAGASKVKNNGSAK